jgi:hypothetical protein
LKQSGREVKLLKNNSDSEHNDQEGETSLSTNGEYELVSLLRRVQDFMRPIIGSASHKRQIDNDINSLLG